MKCTHHVTVPHVLAIVAHVLIFIDLLSCRILESVSPIHLHAFNLEGFVFSTSIPTLTPEDFAFFFCFSDSCGVLVGRGNNRKRLSGYAYPSNHSHTDVADFFHSTKTGTSFYTRNERFTCSRPHVRCRGPGVADLHPPYRD